MPNDVKIPKCSTSGVLSGGPYAGALVKKKAFLVLTRTVDSKGANAVTS